MPPEPRQPPGADDDEVIEGGDVTDVEDLRIQAPPREATARSLALILVSILGLSGAIHYLTTAVLVWNGKTDVADNLGKFFNAWLPVIAGLVGSAITYYFTKERR